MWRTFWEAERAPEWASMQSMMATMAVRQWTLSVTGCTGRCKKPCLQLLSGQYILELLSREERVALSGSPGTCSCFTRQCPKVFTVASGTQPRGQGTACSQRLPAQRTSGGRAHTKGWLQLGSCP